MMIAINTSFTNCSSVSMASISMFVALEMTAGMPYKKRGIFIPTYVQVMMEVLATYDTMRKIPLDSNSH
jgi:hypothetical protein